MATVGTAPTTRLAEADPPLPPSMDLTTLVMLFCGPAALAVALTPTTKLHALSAASVAPDKLMLSDPAMAVIVPPPQLPESPLGVDTTKPAGRVSVNRFRIARYRCSDWPVNVSAVRRSPASDPVPIFASVGGATTVTSAVAVCAAPVLRLAHSTLLCFPPAWDLHLREACTRPAPRCPYRLTYPRLRGRGSHAADPVRLLVVARPSVGRYRGTPPR